MKIPDALFLQCHIYVYKHNIYTHVCTQTHTECMYLEISEFLAFVLYSKSYVNINLLKVLFISKGMNCEKLKRNARKISEASENTF